MKFRGRPILGAFSGLLFGFFGGLALVFAKVITSGNVMVLALPLVFLVVGLVLGLTGPLGRGRARSGAGLGPVGMPPSPPPPPA